MKSTEINDIIENVLNEEVKKAIATEAGSTKKVKYHVTCEGECLATFNSLDEAKEYCEKNKDGELKGKKKLLIDKKTYKSYEEMIDKLDEMNDQLEETEKTENMENMEPMEGNAFVKAMLDAKEKGEDTFTVDGKTHDVKESYKQLEEEEGICEECNEEDEDEKESNESFIEINEGENQPTNPSLWSRAKSMAKSKFDVYPSAYANGYAAKWYKSKGGGWKKKKKKSTNEGTNSMCEQCGTTLMEDGSCMECSSKMNESKKRKVRLTEAELIKLISKMVSESVPGLEAVKKAHSQSTNTDLNDSTKKIADYLKFNGTTKPEFPNQEGIEGEKKAYRNTTDEEEYIDTYRGKGLQDLDYDNKPSTEFVERLRMALEGDPKMGNGQKDTANTIPSKVGSDLYKSIDKEKKTRDAEPMYKKDPQPTTETKTINESEQTSKKVVLEEILRMKNMANYNKKTQ